jgi:hypothetical protein
MLKVSFPPCVPGMVVLLLILLPTENLSAQVPPKWTGFARFTQITESKRGKTVWKMEAHVTNDTGTATHTSVTPDGSCEGTYKTTMSGGYGEGTKMYGFWIPIPPCKGSSERFLGEDETAINVEGQTGDNPNVMSGSMVEKSEGKLMTWEWNFVRSRDAELIVTPQNYDAWMPEPPVKAAKYGNVLGIKLKVQSKKGGKADEKVHYFKLSLTATSKQPGVTINMPIDNANNEPDLRFMEREGVELLDAGGQSIKLTCQDGESGSAGIVSFDGGGWTTLTVEAVLNDSTHLKGQLLKSGGEEDILIPKREASSKIASIWLKQYGNIGDQSDDEALPGNTNKGDGLTAYEEYRGVISKEQFKRLDASKMELAVERTKKDSLFTGGLALFENATGIKVISLDEGELTQARLFNNNHEYAHVTDQYAMRIRNKGLHGISGENQPVGTLNKTPVKSAEVAIDIAENKRTYFTNDSAASEGGVELPYSEADLINNTVAHELGHGVHLEHHGPPSVKTGPRLTANDRSSFTIIDADGRPIDIPNAGYTIAGRIGVKCCVVNTDQGCEASGDLKCIMAYTSLYQWVVYKETNGNKTVYRVVPYIPVGKTVCNSSDGTGINENGGFFGYAKYGDCRAKIKVKDN